jgi:hypothetical protein
MTIDTQNNHYSFDEYLEFCKWHLNTEILVIPFGTAASDYSSGAHLPTPLADMKFVVRFFFPAKDKRFNQQPFSSDFYQSVSESLASPVEGVERYEFDPDDNVIEYNPFSEEYQARVTAHDYGAHSEEFELHCESAYEHLV